MIAPLAKLMDWLAIQVQSVRTPPANGQNPRLEEALRFLTGPDFIPSESHPAQVEFVDGVGPWKCLAFWLEDLKTDGFFYGPTPPAPWSGHGEMRKRIARTQEDSRTSRLPQKHCYPSSMSGIYL